MPNTVPFRVLVWLGGIVLASPSLTGTYADESLVKNGDFQDWQDDVPVDWKIGIGANNGDSKPVSKVDRLPGCGAVLKGDRKTKAWRMVSQVVPLERGKSYRLRFSAQSKGVVREGNQFDNCYVGLMSRDTNGKLVGRAIQDVSRATGKWKTFDLTYRVPAAATNTQVILFLSKTGSLQVKDISLVEATPADPFELLMDEMDSKYSFTEMKRIDWRSLRQQYQAGADRATSPDEFVAAIKPMLSGLKDPHVWIEDAAGRRWSSHWSMFQPNVEPKVLRSKVQDIQEFGSIGWTGRYETFGVIVINSLPTSGDYEALLRSVDAMRDLEGIIVDLRYNKGGSENRAASIAGRFVNTPTTYARNQVMRDGSLVETQPRVLQPSSTKPIRVPVVCLIGPGCISSGEGFALMMKAIEGVTVIGQPTRGASGNPKPVELPGGIKVWFSRWVALEMDGTSIEGRGVQPDEIVSHQRGTDRTFDRAVEILNSTKKPTVKK